MLEPAVVFREIPFGSAQYEEECRLRNEILRVPLGLSLWDEDLSVEGHQIHFGLFDEKEELVACAVVLPLEGKEAKLRQVAVRAEWQQKGLGACLVKEVEEYLHERGYLRITLHARSSVCEFYQKLAYHIEGDAFEEVGLPHRRMIKLLLITLHEEN